MKKNVLFLIFLSLAACMSKEERVKQAYEKGKEEIETKSSYLKGMGETLSKEGKEAAEKMSEGAGAVANGMNEGFDKSMVRVKIIPAPEILNSFSLGRAGKYYNDSTLVMDIVIYTVFEKDFKGRLSLKAYDSDSTEVGRSLVPVIGKAEDAKYLSFPFDKHVPLNIADYFALEIKP